MALYMETERLVLRDWEPGDIDDLVAGLNDIEVSRWLAGVPHPYTRADAMAFLDHCARAALEGERRRSYMLAIARKEGDRAIGGTSIEGIDAHGTATGGIWIGRSHWHHGYGREAFGMRIEFAFRTLGLRRLENGFFEGNESSRHMQEHYGYRIEGYRRERYVCLADGRITGEYTTALLRSEWEKRI